MLCLQMPKRGCVNIVKQYNNDIQTGVTDGLDGKKLISMTRINCGIPVERLSDKHLLAEHREIKRIPNTIKSGKARIEDLPEKFTMGKGHVKFFYNKLKYLYRRYAHIHLECKLRGFNVTDYSEAFDVSEGKYGSDIQIGLWNDYTPTKEDIALVTERLKEKSPEYYSEL